jgi:cyanophycin synthetase
MLQYGQGKYGRHFMLTSSECDSYTGSVLQFNKVISNLLVTRLGLPGVEHGVAQTAAEATRLSNQFGYPLVIKPVDGRQGKGVSVGVASEEEVAVAFQQASAISQGHAIVERFVHGEDVRLYAFAGQFAYAVLRSPARVMGDGMHTIVELIELENHCRPTEGYPKQLKVDQNMIAVLQKQNLQLNDYVPAGKTVMLRSVANASAGGTLTVITDRVHSDNRRMAEAIARCFRLDNVGIDFVTPDITKSWREVPCAVIEVNAVPSLLSTEPIRLLFERTFPGHSAGRIPSVVVVSTEPARGKRIVKFLRHKGLTTGFVDPASICLNDELRVIKDSRLAEKVQALLLDPACEALVVACRPEQIIEQGFPLDRCTLCVLEPELRASEQLRGLLKQCSERVIEQIPTEGALIQWLKEKHDLQE